MTEPAAPAIDYPAADGQVVPLIVLGLTEDLERALDDTGLGWIGCDEPEDAAAYLDAEPRCVLAYGPGVFGRALSARMTRVEACEPDQAVRALILLDRRPGDLSATQVDDDPRRLAFRARIPLRVSTFVVLNEPDHVEALRELLSRDRLDTPS